MAAAKKNSYITADIEYAEFQLKTWREYIDAHPINEVEDRYGPKELPNGKVVQAVISTKEQIINNIMGIHEKYLKMLAVVDELRHREEARMEARGNSKVNPMMERELNK